MSYIRSKEVVWERIDGGALLTRPSSDRAWRLDSLAATVWSLCGGKGGFERAVKAVLRATGMDRASAQATCERLCSQLAARGLMQCAGTPVAIAARSGVDFARFTEIRLHGKGGRRPTPRGNSGPG